MTEVEENRASSDNQIKFVRPTEEFNAGQVPGYLGFVPQIKYNYGKTFANQTRDLAQEFPHRHFEYKQPVDFTDKFKNKLPEPSGHNRYTKDIIPGYSGFVPEINHRHSKTYTRLANECVDNFIERKNHNIRQLTDMHMSLAKNEPLTSPQPSNVENSASLEYAPYGKYKDIDPGSVSRKKVDEAPIPGYTGHVPRTQPTQIGIGSRYHVVSDEGLDDFWTRYQIKFGEQFLGDMKEKHPAKWPTQSFIDDSIRKAYFQEGMVPKFKGYVPQEPYRHGRTYGDTTRDLDVCKHPYETYGEYLRRSRKTSAIEDKVKGISKSKSLGRIHTSL